jgi:uncharacterized RDD family membrane protein YckC
MSEETLTKQPDEIFCASCGSVIKKAAGFCFNCGARSGGEPAGAPTPAPERTGPASAQELNTKGQRLLIEGKLDEALAALNEAVLLAPSHVNAYLNRADVLEKLGRVNEAQGDRQTARALTAAGQRSGPASAAQRAVAEQAGKTVPEGGHLCPMCNREVMPGRRFCYWCDQFLLEGEQPLRAAGAGKRLGGFFIEVVLSYAVIGVGMLLDAASGTFPAFYAAFGLGWLAFYVVLWAQGRTPGKLILGMRVIRTNGERVGFWRMAYREIIGKFVSAIALYIGFLSIAWDKDQQGFHDKIADTLVISER